MNTEFPRVLRDQIIAFADLEGFHSRICAGLNPDEIFEFLAEYYATVQRGFEGSEGRIVKFMGDAILLLLSATPPDASLAALRKVKTAVDAFLTHAGHTARLRVKVHVGQVASGGLGTGDLQRFDVCGATVNEAALLQGDEWVISAELRARLNARE